MRSNEGVSTRRQQHSLSTNTTIDAIRRYPSVETERLLKSLKLEQIGREPLDLHHHFVEPAVERLAPILVGRVDECDTEHVPAAPILLGAALQLGAEGGYRSRVL
jgi:hypothetical protein